MFFFFRIQHSVKYFTVYIKWVKYIVPKVVKLIKYTFYFFETQFQIVEMIAEFDRVLQYQIIKKSSP